MSPVSARACGTHRDSLRRAGREPSSSSDRKDALSWCAGHHHAGMFRSTPQSFFSPLVTPCAPLTPGVLPVVTRWDIIGVHPVVRRPEKHV